jgi:hypothetical protein
MIRSLCVAVSVVFLCIENVFAQVPPPQPPSAATPGIKLGPKWNTKLQGGTETMTDLVRLLDPLVNAGADLEADSSIEIYKGVTYLMPIKDAVKTLGLTGNLPSRNMLGCPGFPKESFFYYTYKGLFADGYNQINIVVDQANQVVCIQLVQEAPKPGQFPPRYTGDQGWRTYNFVSYRNKAMKKLFIDHQLFYYILSDRPDWRRWSGSSLSNYPRKLLRIDTVLVDPDYPSRKGYGENRTLEAVRLYLPVPLAQLILYCINNSMNSGA